MKLLFFAATLCVALASESPSSPHPLSDEFIDLVNNEATTWKAGRNFHEKYPMEYIKKMMGVVPDYKNVLGSHKEKILSSTVVEASLPEEFDARKEWPNCPTLKMIRDQGACGSCWAVSSVEVMSDRECIQSNGTSNVLYSAEDVTSCCYVCGAGCDGGLPYYVFAYWKYYGVVSGGGYHSNQGCSPYEIAPCEHHVPGKRPKCSGDDTLTPDCKQKCRPGYGKTYEDDLHYGKNVYQFAPKASDIMNDIMVKGPVVAALAVYEDFIHYKSGVYQHKTGNKLGYHAIRVLGWGVENNQKYWLIANSWNSDWGDHGYVKILRGVNECEIESMVVAGNPSFKGRPPLH